MSRHIAKPAIVFLLTCTPLLLQAQQADSAEEILALSTSSLNKIDAGKISDVWDGTSTIVKTKLPKESFTQSIREARGRYGVVTERQWVSLQRYSFAEPTPQFPAGIYANAEFSSQLPSGERFFEKISMRSHMAMTSLR